MSEPWESRYRALEEATVAVRDERDKLRDDVAILTDYFEERWNVPLILEKGRRRRAAKGKRGKRG